MVEELKRTVFAPKRKSGLLKTLLGHSLCSLCTGVPSIRLDFDLNGFSKVEYYCQDCVTKLLERAEPEDNDELAAKYHCINGQLPKTPSYKDGKEVIP